jgi:DNA-directed RNA polymerase specialized sigma24 family protein
MEPRSSEFWQEFTDRLITTKVFSPPVADEVAGKLKAYLESAETPLLAKQDFDDFSKALAYCPNDHIPLLAARLKDKYVSLDAGDALPKQVLKNDGPMPENIGLQIGFMMTRLTQILAHASHARFNRHEKYRFQSELDQQHEKMVFRLLDYARRKHDEGIPVQNALGLLKQMMSQDDKHPALRMLREDKRKETLETADHIPTHPNALTPDAIMQKEAVALVPQLIPKLTTAQQPVFKTWHKALVEENSTLTAADVANRLGVEYTKAIDNHLSRAKAEMARQATAAIAAKRTGAEEHVIISSPIKVKKSRLSATHEARHVVQDAMLKLFSEKGRIPSRDEVYALGLPVEHNIISTKYDDVKKSIQHKYGLHANAAGRSR